MSLLLAEYWALGFGGSNCGVDLAPQISPPDLILG